MKQGLISEINDSQNVAYLLNDNNIFFLTGYKVLHNQEKKGLIKCVKLKYNGKLKILYLSSSYRPLSSILSSLNPNSFINMLSSLLGTIIDIKDNGFLKCSNIDISFDRIFIDTNTYSVHLVYLPIISNSSNHNDELLENELRTSLIKLINSTPNVVSDEVRRIGVYLSNGTNSLKQLHKIVRNESAGAINISPEGRTNSATSQQPPMRLLSNDSVASVLFNINKAEFILGKKNELVDGLIENNKAISRVHCKIIYREGYYIVDLDSVNGTFINNVRLKANVPTLIKTGDVLRLANCEFSVSI